MTFAIYNLWQQSETVINPDVGEDSAGPPSRRYGVELNLTYRIDRWLELYGSISGNHTRFTRPFDDGTGHVGTYITDAPVATGSLALYLTHLGPWSGGLDYRYLGNYPLSSGPCNDVAAVKAFPGAATSCANAPTAPGQVNANGFGELNLDAAHAVAWTRRHADQWGGDPTQLYLVGHSSGAYIAVMLALDQEYLQQIGGSTDWLRGVVGLAGPYNFLPFTDEYLKDLFGPPANFPGTQPINHVRPGAPPLLLIQGLRDTTVSPSNTRSLAAAMRRVGGQVKTEYFKKAGHAELVAAFSILARERLPVLQDVRAFIADGAPTSAAITPRPGDRPHREER